jgi:hypothetical protein
MNKSGLNDECQKQQQQKKEEEAKIMKKSLLSLLSRRPSKYNKTISERTLQQKVFISTNISQIFLLYFYHSFVP